MGDVGGLKLLKTTKMSVPSLYLSSVSLKSHFYKFLFHQLYTLREALT